MNLPLQDRIVHSLMTGNNLHFAKIKTLSGPPLISPSFVGETYFDSLNLVYYVGIGISSVNDWAKQSFIFIITFTNNGTIPSSTYQVVVQADTSSVSLSLTMPPHKNGLIVTIVDFNRNSFLNRISLSRNSGIGTIDKIAGNYIIDSDGASVSLISQQSISNWAILA